MKKLFIAFACILVITSCKTENDSPSIEVPSTEAKISAMDTSRYPESLLDVINAHGGLQNWKEMKMWLENTQYGEHEKIFNKGIKCKHYKI